MLHAFPFVFIAAGGWNSGAPPSALVYEIFEGRNSVGEAIVSAGQSVGGIDPSTQEKVGVGVPNNFSELRVAGDLWSFVYRSVPAVHFSLNHGWVDRLYVSNPAFCPSATRNFRYVLRAERKPSKQLPAELKRNLYENTADCDECRSVWTEIELTYRRCGIEKDMPNPDIWYANPSDYLRKSGATGQ